MSKTVKRMYIQSVADRLAGVTDCLVVSLAGLDAPQDYEMRRDLRSKGVRVLVLNNRLAARALEQVGLGPVAGLLNGPAALAWGGASVVELAKAIQRWVDALEPVVVRGGYTAGRVLSADEVKALAKLPSREELLSRVAGQLTASAARVAALALGPARRLAGQIRQRADRPEEAPVAAA